MTDHIRLVTENGQPALTVGPLADVGSEARAFADEVDDGQLGRVDSAIVITAGTQLATHYWGHGMDLITAIGVLEAAKQHIVRKILGED
ncbi:hypothetical protein [Sphingomonas segetis]|uniref:hypothetical protein n=1 Tax=Sphingomonas segetis TaxID=1104779 RepID=UPI0012D370CF|nr:hypothetical protein [Sphingomonas segetis]